MKHSTHPILLAVAILALLASMLGHAEENSRLRERKQFEVRGSHLQLDQRYRHDHYYPARGTALVTLPNGSVGIHFGHGQYYFHGGVWFRPANGRFVVSMPPPGIVVPTLSMSYTTLWIAGAPYYYANDVYYAPVPGQGYAVVAPPPGAELAQPVPVPAEPMGWPALVIYPRNGQSAEQTESDRQDCNGWASSQDGALADVSVFQRAVAACMDGRGYTIR